MDAKETSHTLNRVYTALLNDLDEGSISLEWTLPQAAAEFRKSGVVIRRQSTGSAILMCNQNILTLLIAFILVRSSSFLFRVDKPG